MGSNETFNMQALLDTINAATVEVKNQMDTISQAGSDVGVGDMFKLQMVMNKLSQLSEMSSSVISSANQAIYSMARNVK